MIDVLETRTWFDHRMEVVRIGPASGHKVPCHLLWPREAAGGVPFVLATHGATSSKHEWTELGGYTKGGDLALRLLSAGIAIVAMDLHYHGDNDTADLGGRNVFLPEHFDDFFDRSVHDANTVLEWARGNPALDSSRSAFTGYSLAATFGFWLAGHGAGFKAMILCVPGSGRKAGKYHSPCNNLAGLGNVAILQIDARQDEYIEPVESEWLFANLPISDKQRLLFPGGHSLPIDYVQHATAWLTARL